MTETKAELVRDMLDHVIAECQAIDREQRFRDMLDECYSFDSVGGPFACMSPSGVLEEMDPVAFRCGVNDYMDSEGTVEIDGDDYDSREVDKAAEEYLDELRNELSALEAEIENDDDPDRSEIEELTAKIEACEKHQW
jgi:hypothetical protein